ncbi:MAG TPA: putative DNA binding domain-containing protein, partial [Candidatus Cloacimonadota bacterium]|nr:putative DNA binding domain-containing protein [Candidatus Cloacimonadota bacterium]
MNQINLEETLEIGPSTPTWFVCTCEDIARIGRHACGFLNSEGGTIICGIEENGTVKGVKNAEQLSGKIEEDLLINLRPRSIIALEHKNYKNKDLIIIEIPMGSDKPYGYRDEIYIRRHKRNEKAGIDDIREMIISKSIEPERWERRLSLLMDARDIDKKLLMKAVSIVRKKGLPLQSTTDPYLIMSDLDLARDGSYTQGGDVLFSLNPVKRFPQVRVKATHFSGDKTSDTYLENVVLDGPLIQTLEKCLDFIIRNTPRKSVFPRTKLQREDVSMFPIPALREGLVNAFAHRDYAAYGGGIAINIFLNRLEIWNAGSLPAGFTPDDMTKPHASI